MDLHSAGHRRGVVAAPHRTAAEAGRDILAEGGKTGEDTVKVDGKEIKCKTLAGALKGADGEQIEFKLWLSDDVPGSIVKQVRTTRQKGDKDEVIAETTTTVRSYKQAK